MTQLQKIIKYGAMAFAIFLAVAIIGGIVSAVVGLSFAVDVFTSDKVTEMGATTQTTSAFDAQTVTALEIDLAAADLRIREGAVLQVAIDREDITVKQSGDTLVVEEEEHLLRHENGTVTLTVPRDFSFLTADIDTGAGKIKVDVLKATELSLSLGAGEATFERLEVSKDADIEAGAGKLVIRYGMIEKLDLELGVGKAEIASALGDGSHVECGVGALELALIDGMNLDTYTVKAHTGIGRFTVSGETITDDKTVGSGENVITVEGGIGTVDVTFA